MRVLLIVPPFGGLDRPALGVHTLQSVARSRGHEVDVFYANIAFAARLGEIPYMTAANFGTLTLLGERIMGLKSGSRIPDDTLETYNKDIADAAAIRGHSAPRISLGSLVDTLDAWSADISEAIHARDYDIIGISTTFEQTNGAAAIARQCRTELPGVKLVIGGANCEGEMAGAIAKLIPEIDIVFSGESELTFARYLDDGAPDEIPAIVTASPNQDMESIPPLAYSEYFEQLQRFIPNSILIAANDIFLPYESSRGCWWGQKHHCTFCGLNGGGMGYREKSPEKVCAELAQLADEAGVRRIVMTDNIMPFSYFSTLIPQLGDAELGLDIFYEQKANISLDKVVALKKAGVNRIQPGIEALNDDLLRLMRKGTSGKQNIALLRYSRALGVAVDWNLLSGFPGEQESWYLETLQRLPLMVHLQPPNGLFRLNFDRFSPYFEAPEKFGISNLEPPPSYSEAFPNCENLHELAYHFVGESSGLSVDTSDVLKQVKDGVEAWHDLWTSTEEGYMPPCLEVLETEDGQFLLIDTRPLPDAVFMQQISAQQASVALSFHTEESEATRWAEAQRVCLKTGTGFIPLACAAPELLTRFERIRAPDLEDAAVA